jgi:D-aminopeptidase
MLRPVTRPRSRDLGLELGTFESGPLDAITDVEGVRVGSVTLIEGDGPLRRGHGPVRTGVTVVVPHEGFEPLFAGCHRLNGNGELTGLEWVRESGLLTTPIAITNTHSVGVVRDAILQWQISRPNLQPWGLPVVAETYDGGLNDINGFHIKPPDVIRALDGSSGGAVAEGNVGGGTGMRCLGFKAGTGTASRVVTIDGVSYTVGVLVQCNFGGRQDFRVAGVPVGPEITDLQPCLALDDGSVQPKMPRCGVAASKAPDEGVVEQGSIIVVVATDAPLLPTQLKRLAIRVALGVGRTGGFGGNSSGDIFIAFSTANAGVAGAERVARVDMLPNARITPLFYATVQATEEAILNSLLAATTMTGADGLRIHALPHDRLLATLRQDGRLK